MIINCITSTSTILRMLFPLNSVYAESYILQELGAVHILRHLFLSHFIPPRPLNHPPSFMRSKIFWGGVQKYFLWSNFLGSKKLFGQKKFGHKTFWDKKIPVQNFLIQIIFKSKIFWVKIFFGHRNFWVKKDLVRNFFV